MQSNSIVANKPLPLLLTALLMALGACQAEYEADPPLVNLLLRMEADETSAPARTRIPLTVGYQLRTKRRFPEQIQTVSGLSWQLERRLRSGDTLVCWAISPSAAALLPDSLGGLQGEAADSAALALGLDQISLPVRLSVSLAGTRIASDSTDQLSDSIGLTITVPEP